MKLLQKNLLWRYENHLKKLFGETTYGLKVFKYGPFSKRYKSSLKILLLLLYILKDVWKSLGKLFAKPRWRVWKSFDKNHWMSLISKVPKLLHKNSLSRSESPLKFFLGISLKIYLEGCKIPLKNKSNEV